MKNIFLFLTICFFCLIQNNIYSQSDNSRFEKAVYYYESGDYQIAIPYFSKYILQYPHDPIAYKLRGNCYLEIGLNSKAIQDYQFALKIKPSSDLLFNLGSAYEKEGKTDSSIYYFHRFNAMEPNRSDGFVRLSLLFMYNFPVLGDSAVYYAQKAVSVEPEKVANLNYLAMAYYSKNQYTNALETSQTGLLKDSCFSPLNRTAGISSFFLKDYSSAIYYFERAYLYSPTDYSLLDYKIQSLLLSNTAKEKYTFRSDTRISLTGVSSETLKKVIASQTAKKSTFSYKNQLQKLNSSPLTMSLDEYIMLYIGFAQQNSGLPDKEKTIEISSETSLIKELESIQLKLSNNPVDFPLYLKLADVYLDLGSHEKYFENRFKYFGFIESIKATGDGLSAATAYIINDKNHEEEIMNSLGFQIQSQLAKKQKNQYYDVLSGKDSIGKDVTIYFNLDMPIHQQTKKVK